MSSIEPDPVNYFSVPTLKHIAAVHVAIALNTSSFFHYRVEYNYMGREEFRIYSRRFAEIEEVVSMLPLPTTLKNYVASIIEPIVRERFKWMRFFKSVECAGSLHWTNEGTVDRKKTVEQLIMKSSGHSVERLFELASEYCIETCFPEIYDRVQGIEAMDYLYRSYMDMYHRPLLAYWIAFIKGELPELLHTIKRNYWVPIEYSDMNQSIYQNMLTLMVIRGYPIAVQYFWEKLTDEEKCSNLTEWINISLKHGEFSILFYGYQQTYEYSDILFFLLSRITDGKLQRDVFRKNSLPILNSLFTHWPRQRFLLPTLRTMWNYLDEEVYVTFMSLVVSYIVKGFGTAIILREIWNASPTRFRKCYIHYLLHPEIGNSADIWCNLLLVKDMDAIQMILDDMGSDDRKSVPFSIIENRHLFLVIYTDKLNFFESLVQNVLTSKSDLLALKKSLVENHGTDLCHQWICDNNLEAVRKFLNWAFTSQNQIDEFKSERIDKTRILRDLVCDQNNFELAADEFLNWCISSQNEVYEYKKRFVLSECEIFDKDEENCDTRKVINRLRSKLCENHIKVESCFIFARRIKVEFEFVAKLIHWCCHSEEDIKELKGKFILSKAYLKQLQAFVKYGCSVDKLCEFEVLIKELVTTFLPLDEGVTVELKEKIRNTLYLPPWFGVKHLFRIIDEANGNTGLEIGTCSRSK